MRDIKNITSNRKTTRSACSRWRKQNCTNTFRPLPERKPAGKKLRLILPMVALLLGAYPIATFFISAKPAISSVKKSSPPAVKPLGPLDTFQSFQVSVDALSTARLNGDQLVAPLPDGGVISYGINREVQERVKKVMQTSSVPYGVFVAVEPKTGRILALAGHSSVDPAWEHGAFYGLYPMASLFKIITAAAALEEKKVSADTIFAYNGKLTSVNPKYWYVKPGRRNQEMSLTMAMGKSVNPVFGRLASDVAGRDSLMSCAAKFGFNQVLLPGTCVPPSKAEPPGTDTELKLMGAGLGREVKISPLHAALVMAAIANDGVMMMPSLAEEIKNGRGETVYSLKPESGRRMVSPEIAGQLAKMLSATISSGTSRKVFHDRRGRLKLASVHIAAKTGSIDGKDPAGHYSWFAAYAPMDDPEIAIVALIINQDKWKIKASYLGEQALEAFFR